MTDRASSTQSNGMAGYSPSWAVALGAACALGCGSGGSGDFSDASGPPTSGSLGPGGDGATGEPDGTVSSGETDGDLFAPSEIQDGGIVVQSGACTAGVYRGKFMTYTGVGGEGGSPGPFSFMWNGELTIDLTAQKITMTSMTGGELPTTTSTSTLEIADGGALDGSDTIGGDFFANLIGTLDCSPDAGPPYRLTATLSGGAYKMQFFQTAMIGHLSADYQEAGAGTPPMLVNGDILVAGVLSDGGAPFASASGDWSATWVSP